MEEGDKLLRNRLPAGAADRKLRPGIQQQPPAVHLRTCFRLTAKLLWQRQNASPGRRESSSTPFSRAVDGSPPHIAIRYMGARLPSHGAICAYYAVPGAAVKGAERIDALFFHKQHVFPA